MDMTSETLKYLSDIGYKYKIIDDCKRKTYRLIKFKISKLKGWTFGLFKGQFETVFFCQPTAFIDKFKPSYSFYTAKVFEENIKEIDEDLFNRCLTWECYKIEVENIIKHIRRHPFIAFAEDKTFDKSYVRYFAKSYFDEYCYRFKSSREMINTFIRAKIRIFLAKGDSAVSYINTKNIGNAKYPCAKIEVTFKEEQAHEYIKAFEELYFDGIPTNITYYYEVEEEDNVG